MGFGDSSAAPGLRGASVSVKASTSTSFYLFTCFFPHSFSAASPAALHRNALLSSILPCSDEPTGKNRSDNVQIIFPPARVEKQKYNHPFLFCSISFAAPPLLQCGSDYESMMPCRSVLIGSIKGNVACSLTRVRPRMQFVNTDTLVHASVCGPPGERKHPR